MDLRIILITIYIKIPGKNSWKPLVRCRIQEKEVCAWLSRISAPDFDRFRRLHSDYCPHSLWISSKENSHVISQSISCIQMIAGTVDNVLSASVCVLTITITILWIIVSMTALSLHKKD